jgi:Putative transposase
MDERGVIFATKGGPECVLSGVEFLQRFVDHVLPKGFTRIRHYELLEPCHATTMLERARVLIAPPPQPATLTPDDTPTSSKGALPTWVERLMALTGIDADRSVRCGVGRTGATSDRLRVARGTTPTALRSHPRTCSNTPATRH